jgi:hypothetical protein
MAKAAEAALIDAATARALADGAHGDPFSVLGLHQRGKRLGGKSGQVFGCSENRPQCPLLSRYLSDL